LTFPLAGNTVSFVIDFLICIQQAGSAITSADMLLFFVAFALKCYKIPLLDCTRWQRQPKESTSSQDVAGEVLQTLCATLDGQ
jgi:hypothetical protein